MTKSSRRAISRQSHTYQRRYHGRSLTLRVLILKAKDFDTTCREPTYSTQQSGHLWVGVGKMGLKSGWIFLGRAMWRIGESGKVCEGRWRGEVGSISVPADPYSAKEEVEDFAGNGQAAGERVGVNE